MKPWIIAAGLGRCDKARFDVVAGVPKRALIVAFAVLLASCGNATEESPVAAARAVDTVLCATLSAQTEVLSKREARGAALAWDNGVFGREAQADRVAAQSEAQTLVVQMAQANCPPKVPLLSPEAYHAPAARCAALVAIPDTAWPDNNFYDRIQQRCDVTQWPDAAASE